MLDKLIIDRRQYQRDSFTQRFEDCLHADGLVTRREHIFDPGYDKDFWLDVTDLPNAFDLDDG